jgi:hypothetical protein
MNTDKVINGIAGALFFAGGLFVLVYCIVQGNPSNLVPVFLFVLFFWGTALACWMNASDSLSTWVIQKFPRVKGSLIGASAAMLIGLFYMTLPLYHDVKQESFPAGKQAACLGAFAFVFAGLSIWAQDRVKGRYRPYIIRFFSTGTLFCLLGVPVGIVFFDKSAPAYIPILILSGLYLSCFTAVFRDLLSGRFISGAWMLFVCIVMLTIGWDRIKSTSGGAKQVETLSAFHFVTDKRVYGRGDEIRIRFNQPAYSDSKTPYRISVMNVENPDYKIGPMQEVEPGASAIVLGTPHKPGSYEVRLYRNLNTIVHRQIFTVD